RGTEAVPAGTFSRLIAEQGGADNAFTSHDYTAYYETVAADRFGMIMQMEADRMQNLDINPQTAATELNVVLAERQERTDNSPQGLFAEKVRRALFPQNPYGIPVIGWKAEMEKITPEAAEDFYRHHYAPNNAVVVISGNVDFADVLRLAAGTYGRLPPRAVPARKPVSFPKKPNETRIVMTDARVQQPHLERHIIAPSYAAGKKDEAYALEVLSEAIGGGEVGVLYRQLVMKQKVASAVETSYDPEARGPADFVLIATPQPGRDIKDLERALDAAVKRLAQQGLDAATVKAAKGRLMRAAVFARDSLTAPGYSFGEALAVGETVKDVENWPARIGAVTAEQVNAALRKLVASPYHVTGLLLPDPDAPPERAGATALSSQGGEDIR
ncbi:MAG: pitrilysin family protein, partial [Alphaproteobacteria bacterium]|nr:pitrilysin family protein [Alphaproteobacteria bacterium]